jgi:hypothetical protein
MLTFCSHFLLAKKILYLGYRLLHIESNSKRAIALDFGTLNMNLNETHVGGVGRKPYRSRDCDRAIANPNMHQPSWAISERIIGRLILESRERT